MQESIKQLGIFERALCVLHIEHIVKPAIEVVARGRCTAVNRTSARHSPLLVRRVCYELEIIILPLKVNAIGQDSHDVRACSLMRLRPRTSTPIKRVQQLLDTLFGKDVLHRLDRIFRNLVEQLYSGGTMRGGMYVMVRFLNEKTALGIL